MGLIARLLGLAPAVTEVAEVFVENRTKRAAHDHAEQLAALAQLDAEFDAPRNGWFDTFVNGLNRLPRPAMALGTIGLFSFAMTDPVSFGIRVQGLALVPEPLWWLLGAVVSFYFGARELHHFRGPAASVSPQVVARTARQIQSLRPGAPVANDPQESALQNPERNAAVIEWRNKA